MKLIQGINSAAKILRSGAVLAHPTDTCYGLAADLESEAALKKLQAIKGRDGDKPMSIMLPSWATGSLEDYVALDDFSRKVCEKLLPGPVTIVLPKGPKIPDHYFPETDTIGIRIPDNAEVEALLSEFGRPIITTSANRSGEPACYASEEVEAVFLGQKAGPEAILQGEIVDKKPPSTVIRIEDKKIKVLREGSFGNTQIEAILETSLDY